MKIVVHASLDFHQRMVNAATVLSQFGCKVLLPDLRRYQHIRDVEGNREEFSRIKRRLQRKNGINVSEADAVLVINPFHRGIENYVGGNSFYEMAIAFYLGKPIMLTNPIPQAMSYTEEIEAFDPLIIGPVEDLTIEAWVSYADSAGICK